MSSIPQRVPSRVTRGAGFWLAGLLLGIAAPADAVTLVLASPRGGNQQIGIQVGSGGPVIDVVSFTVPANSVASGLPVAGTPDVLVEVSARRSGPDQHTYTLTVDSSQPLVNAAAGHTLPFSLFYWTTSDNDIPPGRFNDSANQLLLQFLNSRRIYNTHSFFYDNTAVPAEGSYTGRLTYTLSSP